MTDSHKILDGGAWPNFHDAEIHRLAFHRGDVRPEASVWVGTRIEATFELCAIQHPYQVTLAFYDCDQIKMRDFNHQNALYDLHMAFVSRGLDRQGQPLTPFIAVNFTQAFGVELSFRCFRVKALTRGEGQSDQNP